LNSGLSYQRVKQASRKSGLAGAITKEPQDKPSEQRLANEKSFLRISDTQLTNVMQNAYYPIIMHSNISVNVKLH
jgi:hypothetical protein